MQRLSAVRWHHLPKLKEALSLNKILYVLIFSEFILVSSYGFIAPIFAIFLTDRIAGASLLVIGIAEAIYLGTKSLLQVPFGILIDKSKGEKIDFWFLFVGNIIMSLGLFLYLFAALPKDIYLISFFYGIGNALAYPSWAGIFTRNIVKDRESFAWGFSTTIVEMGEAAAAILGAVIAQFLGFDLLFIVVGTASLVGSFALFFTYKDLKIE